MPAGGRHNRQKTAMNKTKSMTWGLGVAVIMTAMHGKAGDADAAKSATQARQPSVFQKMDADGDGHITATEFQAHRAAWFKEIDADGDGKLTADEFAKDQQARFKGMDANGNGVVVAEEYTAFFGGPEARIDKEAPPTRIDKSTLFETMDVNNDGNVTVPECVAYRVAIFRQLDTNGDGKLTPEELAAEAEKRFAAMDANKDHTIAQDEFDATGVNKPRASLAPETNRPAAK